MPMSTPRVDRVLGASGTFEMKSPGGGSVVKRTVPICMEDLDQDFAYEIFENFQLIKEIKDDFSKIKISDSQTKDLIVDFMKEQQLSLRTEVRTTLKEHYAYLKELHS